MSRPTAGSGVGVAGVVGVAVGDAVAVGDGRRVAVAVACGVGRAGGVAEGTAVGENFVFGPVAEGRYTVFVELQGEEYRQPVEVRDGEVTTLEIVTTPYRTPTPAP